MRDLNFICLIGRLVRDAELKKTKNGTTVAAFDLACGYDDSTSFFTCEWYGKGPEGAGKYLTKGKQIGIVGALRQDRWEKDGQKRQRVKIIVDKLQLLGGKTQESSDKNKNENGEIPF
jgi:single-strand DNA-binding protein